MKNFLPVFVFTVFENGGLNGLELIKRIWRIRVKNINYKLKLLVEKLAIDYRIEKVEETEAYITVKDHKEGFIYRFTS